MVNSKRKKSQTKVKAKSRFPALDKFKSSILTTIAKKRDAAISRLTNSSAVSFSLKWLLTNWVTVLLVTVMSIYAIRFYLGQEALKEQRLKTEIAALNIDLAQMKKENAEFLARIKEIDKLKKKNSAETQKVRDSANKLDSNAKKALLLSYKSRLLSKRKL